MSRLGILCTALLVSALIAGCGGGGVDPSTTTAILTSEASLDGYGMPGGLTTNLNLGAIGDYNNNQQYRAWVSFPIGSLPAGADIESAILRVYQASPDDGGYTLGPVLVQHVSFGVDTFSAYSTAALSNISGSLSTEFAVGYHAIDVTAAVQDDITNSRLRSQFRFRHQTATDSDSTTETDSWYMGDSATNKPQLVVTYR